MPSRADFHSSSEGVDLPGQSGDSRRIQRSRLTVHSSYFAGPSVDDPDHYSFSQHVGTPRTRIPPVQTCSDRDYASECSGLANRRGSPSRRAISGLFEVADGIWRARGFDKANMTIIGGETGWEFVDPIRTQETSVSALKVMNEN